MPAWTPARLGAALHSWWKADAGVTAAADRVSAWADQSGNGNTLVQPSAPTGSPLYVAASNVGSKPALRFAAASSEFLQRVFTAALAQPATVYIAYYAANTANDRYFLARSGVGTNVIRVTTAHDVLVNMGTNLTAAGTFDNGDFGLCCVIDGVSSAIYVDDFTTPKAAATTGANAVITAAGVTTFIGVSTAGTAYFDGDIAEILLVSGANDQATRNLVRDYFNARYGLGIV